MSDLVKITVEEAEARKDRFLGRELTFWLCGGCGEERAQGLVKCPKCQSYEFERIARRQPLEKTQMELPRPPESVETIG